MQVVRLAGCENIIGESLYAVRSLILIQCRDLKMGVI